MDSNGNIHGFAAVILLLSFFGLIWLIEKHSAERVKRKEGRLILTIGNGDTGNPRVNQKEASK